MTGQEFRKIRKSMGLSQEKLAIQLGVTGTTVYRWECLDEIPTTAEHAIRWIQVQPTGT